MSIITFVVDQFKTNPVFSGLTSSMMLGAVLYIFRTVPDKILSLLKFYFVFSITLFSEEHVYDEVMIFLKEKGYTKKFRKLKKYEARNSVAQTNTTILSVGDGTHYFFYKRKLLFIDHSTEGSKEGISTGIGHKRKSTLKIFTLCFFKKSLFDFINDCHEYTYGPEETRLKIFTWKFEWQELYHREKRSLDTIFLDDNKKEIILDDIYKFLNPATKERYKRNGLRYKRSYLFHGKPGTGKTTFIFSIASHLNMGVYYFSPTTFSSEGDVLDAFSSIPRGSIIVIEDIDTFNIVNERAVGAVGESNNSKFSMSLFLNILDGFLSSDNILLFITTNRLDELDTAIKRKGRISLSMEFDSLTPTSIYNMFLNSFPDKNSMGILESSKDKLYSLQPISGAEVEDCIISSNDIISALNKLFSL